MSSRGAVNRYVICKFLNSDFRISSFFIWSAGYGCREGYGRACSDVAVDFGDIFALE